MRLSVLVPTFDRPDSLDRCLKALAGQNRRPDQVLLVVREEDQATLYLAAAWSQRLPIVLENATEGGQVSALNAGLEAADGDVIAITDDDAAPRPDWLERIEQHFQLDEKLGGVGGRDWVHDGSGDADRSVELVGKIQWFGRLVGNHHLGKDSPREVDFLKGANMSYRRSALAGLAFDKRLRGEGAQVCNDLAFSLSVQRNGWKLIYDPAVSVDHYPAPRFDSIGRGQFNSKAAEITAFNRYWAVSTAMRPGLQRSLARVWLTAVGSSSMPGYLHLIVGLIRLDKNVWRRWMAAQNGREAASRQLVTR